MIDPGSAAATRLGVVLRSSKVAQVGEVVLVFLMAAIVVAAGWSFVGDNALHRQAVVWVANILMLATIWGGLRVRGQGWADLGLALQAGGLRAIFRTAIQAVIVLVLAVTTFIVGGLVMQNVVASGAGVDTSGYDYLRGNLPRLLMALAAVYVVSSFGEEVLYRGFLISRLQGILGAGRLATVVSVFVSALIFGLVHFDWGVVGVVQTSFMGLVFAAAYVITRRNLWALVLAHAIMDTLLLIQVYGSAVSS